MKERKIKYGFNKFIGVVFKDNNASMSLLKKKEGKDWITLKLDDVSLS